MAGLVDDLNALLISERGVVEAVAALVGELRRTDPDIADSALSVVETAKWSCSGLYHRINHLGGTPTLDTDGLAEQISDLPDTKSKIERICEQENKGRDAAERILDRGDLDADTRGFLDDMINAQADSVNWCEATLDQWKVDM